MIIIKTLFASIFVFLFVVLIHEFGHFITAKKSGMLVREFSIGMGPMLYSKKKGETRYSLRLLPIGGFVALEGEEEDSAHPRAFSNMSALNRMIVILAGATMNFLLGLIVLIGVYTYMGDTTLTLGDFSAFDEHGSPMQEAGFLEGDTLYSVDDVILHNWEDLIDINQKLTPGESVSVTVIRDGDKLTKDVNPIYIREEGRVFLGASSAREISLSYGIREGFNQFISMLTMMFSFIISIFTGMFEASSLSGPVGIVSAIGEATSYGLTTLLMFFAFININVGVFNLLPLPALDGGKLLFILFETVRGRPVSKEREGLVHMIGFILLIGIVVFATFQDLAKIFGI